MGQLGPKGLQSMRIAESQCFSGVFVSVCALDMHLLDVIYLEHGEKAENIEILSEVAKKLLLC